MAEPKRITLKEAIEIAVMMMEDLPDPQPRSTSISEDHASWHWGDYEGSITLSLDTRFENRRIVPVVYLSSSIGTHKISDARSFATLLTTATARGLTIQNVLDQHVIVP